MIGVAFNGDEERVKSNQHVYQWDTGQKVMVSGLGNSAINKVHFSFKGLTTAYVVDTTNTSGTITVDVPDIVLRYGKDIYMYLCIKNTTGILTIKTVIIPVVKRNMPENYMYNDEETVETSIELFKTNADAITENNLSAIEAKGIQTLDSIPDDYATLQEDVNDVKCAVYDVTEDVAYTGKYMNKDGDFISNSYSSGMAITRFIPCQYGDMVSLGAVHNASSNTPAFCMYDKNKTFIGSYISKNTTAWISDKITVENADCAYIRVNINTKATTNYIKIKSADYITTEKTTSTPSELIIDFPFNTVIAYTGKYMNKDGDLFSNIHSSGMAITRFIPCQYGDMVSLGAVHNASSNTPAFCMYDKNKTFIGSYISKNTTAWISDKITVENADCAYIRVNINTKATTNYIKLYTNSSFISNKILDDGTETVELELGKHCSLFNHYLLVTGEEVSNGYSSEMAITDYIPVECGDIIYLGAVNNASSNTPAFCMYDKNKTFIGSCVSKNTTAWIDDVYCIGNPECKYIRANIKITLDNSSLKITSKSNIAYKLGIQSQLFGKNVLFFGDSITDSTGDTTGITYPSQIEKQTGCGHINYACYGSGFAINTVTSGGHAVWGTDNTKVVDMIQRSVGNTPNIIDYIVVSAGTNDWWFNVQLGTFSEATTDSSSTTFYSYLGKAVRKLFDAYPLSKYLFITPLPRTNSINNGVNNNGVKLEAFVNAIKEVCDYYSIPVLDMQHNSNMHLYSSEAISKYTRDGLHPTLEYARDTYAPMVINKLTNI